MSRGGAASVFAAVLFCGFVALDAAPSQKRGATGSATETPAASPSDRGDRARLLFDDGTEFEWERRRNGSGRLEAKRVGDVAKTAGWRQGDEATGEGERWTGDVHSLLDGLKAGESLGVRRGRQSIELEAFFAGWPLIESRPHELAPLSKPRPLNVRGSKGAYDLVREARGAVLLLNFWATWCGPCRSEMPVIQRIHVAYESRGVRVVGVNMDEDGAGIRGFLEGVGVTYLNVRAGTLSGPVARDWGIEGIPLSVIVRADGRIAHVDSGFRGDRHEAWLSGILDTVLASASPVVHLVH